MYTRSQNAYTMAIVFDIYRDVSLKSATRDDHTSGKRKIRRVLCDFHIEGKTNIEKVYLSEILAGNETNQSQTEVFMKTSRDHLIKGNVGFIIAGNNITFEEGTIMNNHQEADMLIINCLCVLHPIDATAIVHSANTDVFALLLN